MAPIVRTAVPKTVKAAEAGDNNAKSTRTSSSSSSRVKDEIATKRTPASRTSTPTGSSAAASSASSKVRTSSASSTASRAGASSSPKEPAQPQTKPSARKDAKTPPALTSAGNNNVAAPQPQDAAKPTRAALPLPSATLHKHKQAAVFNSGKKRHKTNFSSAYDGGSIPCRINHGSIKNAVQWTKAPETLAFDPLLVTCTEGFLETEHPFVFLSRQMFRELMQLEDAPEKTLPVLPRVIAPLRAALMAKEEDVFLMALEATRLLSEAVEHEMNAYVPKLAQQIHRRMGTARGLRAQAEETLAALERNGGKEALAMIRAKIPTYVSVNI